MAAASSVPAQADYLSSNSTAVVKTEYMDDSENSPAVKNEYNMTNPVKSELGSLNPAAMVKTEFNPDSLAMKAEVLEAVDAFNKGFSTGPTNGHASLPSASTSGVEEEGAIDIQVRNVVCTFSLPLHVDLRRVALHAGNVSYDKGQGVLMKQKRNPSCYVKVYSSGKVYIVGCRSEGECRKAARGVARMIQRGMGKKDDPVRMRNYRVCNIMATCKMPFGIKIEEMSRKYPQQSQYEPELSVGLVWRNKEPKGTMRIHTTGSITVTGALSEDAVMQMIEMMYPIVLEFKCPLRLRDPKKPKQEAPEATVKRKRSAPARPRAQKRPRTVEPTSGVIGGAVYFSDEDDFYEELDADDDGELA